ncbi:MAG: hypothetical protein BGO41_07185 [Clostridiales bacterium 38-18]|jgi:hypothetical protein|nr:MAG: hypothetical protein BGO41_07185 [Clostridiales bacterium 38-18]HAS92929.1 hypothetical protein [Clostridiales bacterium]
MDLWQVLVFFTFPVASVLLMFFLKRKALWISPIISTGLSIIYSILVMPDLLTVPESSIFWRISIPMQLIVVIFFTAIAYIFSWLLKRRRLRNK